MYNDNLKMRFIRWYARTPRARKTANAAFSAMKPYEEAWGADLSTKSQEVLQPVIDGLIQTKGFPSGSRYTALMTLKAYALWYLNLGIAGACDGMLRVEVEGVQQTRKKMVANPMHLQSYLDILFKPENAEEVDNIYRCYGWLLYGGIKKEDALLVKTSDVDFSNLQIAYQDTHVPIYPAAVPALINAAQLEDFVYEHPKYREKIRRKRVPGDTLIRGFKADFLDEAQLQAAYARKRREATNLGLTNARLTFANIWLSGLFYRMCQQEQVGGIVDFSATVVEHMDGREYTVTSDRNLDQITKKIINSYSEHYQQWKLAFLTQ